MSGTVVRNHMSTPSGSNIQCNTENFVPIVVPGLSAVSSSSSASTSSTSLPHDPSDDSSSNRATTRSDSTSIPACGNQSRDSIETKNTNKNTDIVLTLGNRLRDLPEWSEELTEKYLEYERVNGDLDVTGTTHTNLDALQESRIDNYWNVDVNRNLSDSWTGFTEFTILNENLPEDIGGPASGLHKFKHLTISKIHN